jgi:RimJ/RimL family protein N-acetyltransferase
VTGHAFGAHQEIHRLYAVPFACNPASARILQKAGYRCEGILRQSIIKDGRILDQWMYAILREEWQALEAGGV